MAADLEVVATINWDATDRLVTPAAESVTGRKTPVRFSYRRSDHLRPDFLEVVIIPLHQPGERGEIIRPTERVPDAYDKRYADTATGTAYAVLSQEPPVYQSVEVETVFPRGVAYRTDAEYDVIAQTTGQAAMNAARQVEEMSQQLTN